MPYKYSSCHSNICLLFFHIINAWEYHVENTSSPPTTRVKRIWAWLVLRWVTIWKHHVLLTFNFKGIAIRYELDGPGIKSWYVAIFSVHIQIGPAVHSVSCTVSTRYLSRERSPPIQGRGFRKSRDINLLPFQIFKVCSRMNFTLTPSLPSGLFSTDFPTKNLYACLPCPVGVMWLAHLIILAFISVLIFREKHKWENLFLYNSTY